MYEYKFRREFMICNYCGTEIADNLKQCPECGMPTENLAIPAPQVIQNKKKKKKAFDPNEVKPNVLGNISVLTAFASVAACLAGAFFGGIGVLLFWLAKLYLFGVIVAAVGIFFGAIGLIAAIVALVMALKAREKKDLPQASPLVGLCFSVLGIIFAFCEILLLILYALI